MSKRADKPAWFRVFGHVKPIIQAVPDEAAGRALKAILEYFDTGAEQVLPDPLSLAVYNSMRPYVDESVEDYRASSERGRRNVQKRWEREKGIPLYTSATEAETETETETDPEGEGEAEAAPKPEAAPAQPRSGAGRPPTAEEAREYCRSAGLVTDPERFRDYYAARGWRMGGEPMADWRAALRAWAAREARPGDRASAAKPVRRGETAEPVQWDDTKAMAQIDRLLEKMQAQEEGAGAPPDSPPARGTYGGSLPGS